MSDGRTSPGADGTAPGWFITGIIAPILVVAGLISVLGVGGFAAGFLTHLFLWFFWAGFRAIG